MESSTDQVYLTPGMDVVSLDDDKIGKIVALDDSQITVEKGIFFPKDYVIPMSAVESADDDAVYLNISKDDALNQRWNDTIGSSWNAGSSSTIAGYDAREVVPSNAGTLGASDLTTDSARGYGAAETVSDDTLTIPVREEELVATKQKVDAGQVQVNTQVVTEDRTLEVPITEERVRVTRRVVDRAATGADSANFEGGTINVPVSTEQVDLQKRVRVAEEVEVAKEAVQKTQQVGGTVRREVVDVADNTNVDVIDGASGAGAKGATR